MTLNLENEYVKVKKELEEMLNLEPEKEKKSIYKSIEIPNRSIIKSLENHMQKIYDYDELLFNHSIKVSMIGAFIARNLGLTPDEIDELYIAGALHDIGKICIPKEILNKTEKLDENERKIIEAHPAYSIWYLTVKESEEKTQYYSYKILDMVRYHHEEVNGHGYPYGLQSNQINIGTKILSVADKLEAYGAKRSYHDARTLSQCIEFIELQGEEGVLDSKLTTAVVFVIKGNLGKE